MNIMNTAGSITVPVGPYLKFFRSKRLLIFIPTLICVIFSHPVLHATDIKRQPVINAVRAVRAAWSKSTSAHIRNLNTPQIALSRVQDLFYEYSENSEGSHQLGQPGVRPLALAAGDFDEDGVADLLSAFATTSGGIIALYRGNADSIFPNRAEAQRRKSGGTLSEAPFLEKVTTFATDALPEFLATGDFNADGHVDLAFANRSSNALWFMLGDGQGNLNSGIAKKVPGRVTALESGDVNRRNGLADLVVATRLSGEARLLIFESNKGAMNAQPEGFDFPTEISALSIADLDGDSFVDVALAAGKSVSVISGHDQVRSSSGSRPPDRSSRIIYRRTFDSKIRSLVSDEFSRTTGQELALLTQKGSIYICSKAGAKGNPLTQISFSESGRFPTANCLLSAQVSSNSPTNLLVLDSVKKQVHVLASGEATGTQKNQVFDYEPEASCEIAFDTMPAAVLPMRLNGDGLSDLVILREGQNALTLAASAPQNVFTVSNTNDSGPGSLREAIINANTTLGADLITFNIGTGPQIINLLSSLPELLDTVTIDATTQPGFAGNPIIVLPGPGVIPLNAPQGSIDAGFVLSANNCTIQGFVINNWLNSGVFLSNGSNSIIRTNFIGTNLEGDAPVANGVGISLGAPINTLIGGSAAAARNIISGNLNEGLRLGSDSTLTQIQGNYIGTDVSGTFAVDNTTGVLVFNSPNNTIGGTVASARNLISGNVAGVVLFGNSATGNLVQGNFIGTQANGIGALPNTKDGVAITDGTGNIIGGAGGGNRIAFNNDRGVNVLIGLSNSILENSIFSNGALGIDLNNDGVTANDAGDPDSGANNSQNFPDLTFATFNFGGSTILGTLNSTPNTNFRIEFFSNPTCDSSGNGEGQNFIGSTVVTTDASGNAPINATVPVVLSSASVVTATATDSFGNTSEFSECEIVTPPPCTIACPPDVLVETSSNQCGSVINYPLPEALGDCPTIICTPPTGSFFDVGITQVTCAIEDGPSCSFTVTVVDQTPPTLTCPQNITQAADPGKTNAVVNYALPAVTDNCPNPTLNCSPPPGTTFPLGISGVLCQSRDESNNLSTCTFSVIITDNQAPAIQCPPNQTVNAATGMPSAIVTYPAPQITDNDARTVAVCVPPSGSAFAIGVTTVTCTATDTGGNRASCNFTVTVTGGAPIVTITPQTITLGVPTPLVVNRKPAKAKNLVCQPFFIENRGFATLNLTLESILRIGTDVTNGKITDPNENGLYSISQVNPDGSQTTVPIGTPISLVAGQRRNFCLRFNPVIPAVTTANTGLRAPQALPDVINSQVNFRIVGGALLTINVTVNMSTQVILINGENPKVPAAVILERAGDEFIVTYSAYDSNLDVTKTKYEFLDANGGVVAVVEVDLRQTLSAANLVRGQSFTVVQRFTGAASHPEVASVRVTVFDAESNTTSLLTALFSPSNHVSWEANRLSITPATMEINKALKKKL